MSHLKVIAMAVLVGGVSALGAVTVNDSFGYPVGDLAGSGGGTGFGAAWAAPVVAGPGTATVAASSVTADGVDSSGGGALLTAAKNAGGDGSVTINRTLGTPLVSNPGGAITVQPYYISFTAQLDPNLFTQVPDAGQRQWGTSLELKLLDTSNGHSFSLGKQGGAASWNLANSGFSVSMTGPAIGTDPVLMVMKFAPSSWNVTNVSLWVNPSSIGGTEPATTLTGSTNIGYSFDQIQLSATVSGWMGPATYSPNHSIDEIRVGDTWADVTPVAVPEPAAAGLLTLSSLALLRRRKA